MENKKGKERSQTKSCSVKQVAHWNDTKNSLFRKLSRAKTGKEKDLNTTYRAIRKK
jgi:hypothetical protein